MARAAQARWRRVEAAEDDAFDPAPRVTAPTGRRPALQVLARGNVLSPVSGFTVAAPQDPVFVPVAIDTQPASTPPLVVADSTSGLRAVPRILAVAEPIVLTGTDAATSASADPVAPTQTAAPLLARMTDVADASLAAPAPNRIVLENQKQGNPQSEWDLIGGPSSRIEGFATDISVNLGGTVSFKINTDATAYRIDVYRLGYYGGDGARKVGTIQHQGTTSQPDALRDAATGLVDAGNWSVTDTWQVPTDLVSGVYIAKLVRTDGTTGENHIPFIVRDDASASDLLFQTADTTWQAYNGWGGANLYGGNGPGGGSAPGRAYKVSYNRPITTREGGGTFAGPQDFVFGAEHSAIRWLEMNGYDVSYMSGVDADRYGALISNHKVFISAGHDEYWSGAQRAHVETARDAGVNLAFLGGNDVYWKTRWETSIDGSGTAHRTLVSYKETREGGDIDPSPEWTGTWRDMSANPSTGGGRPENGLSGTLFQVDSYRQDAITVPYGQSQLRFWRDTAVAQTQPGQSTTLVDNILGYEWNIAPDNAFAPDGLVRLSTTTLDVDTMLIDYGTAVTSGTATHSLTLYRAPSGALVFSSGTVYWTWGLDENHDLEPTPTDPNIQQAMVNLFADMGVQPQTLQASLVLATQTTDLTAPVSTIASLPTGTLVEGQRVTITGTASDVGGRVGAVEVSTDGGANWRLADGTPQNWTYSFTTGLAGTYTVRSRAVDDSLNMEAPGGGVSLTVGPATSVSLFQPTDAPRAFPSVPGEPPPQACCNVCLVHVFGPTELGVKFRSDRSGTISSIRFYKNAENTGPHVGSLWTVDGQLLAQATFTAESASGWQQVNFAAPVTIAADTTYVASYHTTTGLYLASEVTQFAEVHRSGPLTALASGWEHGPNGLIAYGPAGSFPTGQPQSATNYWVDVVFNPASEIGNLAPVANADTGLGTAPGTSLRIAAATLLANDTDTNGDPLTITGVSGAVHGTATFDHVSHTVTFTPEAGYTGPASFSYTITDGRGGSATSTASVTVDPALTTYSLFAPNAVPAVTNTPDSAAVTLGMKFSATQAGTITGIRFYKGTLNTGSHTGGLWTAGGALLASATFTSETASGWQQVSFAAPVTIAAGTTYVASYHTTSGFYSSTTNGFAAPVANGPLTAPASTASGGNGVFQYGAAPAFPTQSFNAANYWVDVVFRPADTGPNLPPVAVADAGFSTARDTSLAIQATMLLANDSDPNGDALVVTGVGNATHGSVSYDAANAIVTFTPEAGYQGDASFAYTISDGRGGTATGTASLTVTPPSTSITLFSPSDVPAVVAVNDPSAVELGVRFTSTSAGTISAIRFYKSALNTGVHTGSIWSATGALLASATFSGETASGWQQVTLAAPVSVTAGSSYVASYHTNAGYYSATGGYFNTAHASGPLTAPAGANGVFAYGGSQFPTGSFNATNYWVDVVFNPSVPPPNQSPVANADSGFRTAQNLPLVISAASLLANDTDPDGDALTIVGVEGASNGTATFDATTGTITFSASPGAIGPAGFSYTASDGRGGTATASVAVSVTDPVQTLFGAADLPGISAVSDPSAIELGVKFTAAVNGAAAGIRFYKGAGNTGPHTGTLWTAGGTALATTTFTAETGSGWQVAYFDQPVALTIGASYVASYHTNTGFYSASPAYFESALTNGPLTAPASSLAGGNGVYAYGATQFPTGSYNATNYWVDVLFDPAGEQGNTAPIATRDTLTTLRNTALVIPESRLLANDTDANGDPLAITGVSGATHGSVAFDAQTRTVSFTPDAGYVGPAGFAYAISDGRGGTASASVGLGVAQTLFAPTDTPSMPTVVDPSAIELGVAFSAAADGFVSGVRFYKGAQNTGTHTGSLWTANGTRLATATFSNETASGWQQVDFANPVAISAGTTYVASYHTDAGYYSATPAFFGADHVSGQLMARASAPAAGNGLFAYGSDSLFPTGSYNATNYWVDVVFQGQLA